MPETETSPDLPAHTTVSAPTRPPGVRPRPAGAPKSTPARRPGQKVVVDCAVYVDGKRAGHHEGGYSGFRVDVTGLAPAGRPVPVAVAGPGMPGTSSARFDRLASTSSPSRGLPLVVTCSWPFRATSRSISRPADRSAAAAGSPSSR